MTGSRVSGMTLRSGRWVGRCLRCFRRLFGMLEKMIYGPCGGVAPGGGPKVADHTCVFLGRPLRFPPGRWTSGAGSLVGTAGRTF